MSSMVLLGVGGTVDLGSLVESHCLMASVTALLTSDTALKLGIVVSHSEHCTGPILSILMLLHFYLLLRLQRRRVAIFVIPNLLQG